MNLRVLMPLKDEPKGGKGFFFQRLARALLEVAVEVVSDPKEPHDIYLDSNKFRFKTKKLRVLRIDGVYHSTHIPYKKMNEEIAHQMKKADGIVFQSRFCMDMTNEYIGKMPVLKAIIFNGADPRFYAPLVAAGANDSRNFICSARYRPHKRLKETIQCFLEAKIPNTKLYVAGDIKDSGLKEKPKDENVIFLGKLSQESLGAYYKSCRAMIHLCSTDWCPNAVVEALCADTPVICSNTGGTRELLTPGSGTIVDIDKPYDMKPFKLYKPAPFNHELVIDAMRYHMRENFPFSVEHIRIQNIAAQYKQFFQKVIFDRSIG